MIIKDYNVYICKSVSVKKEKIYIIGYIEICYT